MRVCLFTDTLGDVNGVSRFIRNVAEQALAQNRDLYAITSTRFECPDQPNIVNLKPLYARPMPKYPNLDIVFPPNGKLLALADKLKPDAIHVSTPGPVGFAGLRAARRLGVPLLGTYHTDFPAYVDHLFDDAACTWICSATMKVFYRPFSRLFTRSADYAEALVKLGIPRGNIDRLLPGIDTDTFHTRHRPEDVRSFWGQYAAHGVDPDAVKVLFVGRVSIEKNLPMLARVWPGVVRACEAAGRKAQLVIIGDGPYRATMQRDLAEQCPGAACFLGFRHGLELSRLYAACDLFAFPSTTDTLGQVVMEAQSAGLPVIVTDQGGPSEVVDKGLTGYVLPADDAPQWIGTMASLIRDDDRRRTMGAAGHRKIQPMSIRDSFAHFWEVHEKAVNRKK